MTPTAIQTLGGVRVQNTANIINADTKMCVLLYAASKFGKTTCAGSLDKMTKTFAKKPTLFIAVEAAEGGGTMSIEELGVDYVTPQDWGEFTSLVAALQTDKTYGGVVLDNATDLVKRFIQPYALKMPYSKGTPDATRAMGVPAQGDYQTMSELMRSQLNQLMALTKHRDMSVRKHLIVCGLEKNKTDRDGALIRIQPDLPGAMAEDASAMFQTVASIAIKTVVTPVDPANPKAGTKRTSQRVLVTQGDGVKILGDRTKCFPKEGPPDFCEIWERYFIPKIEKRSPVEPVAA